MKKTIAFLTLLALVALPASAMAAKTGDFEIGGYIKLHTYWDSTNSVNKNIGVVATRDNGHVGALNNPNVVANRQALQGRWRFTAQDTRFNFKIKGPEVWGAKTQGYIELDFDGVQGQEPNTSVTSAWTPRLRHAWFRMDWPGGWQVLMGQYWGVFCNFWPDTVNSGPLFAHGMPTQRLPQVRVTLKTGPWTFTGLAGAPLDNVSNATGAFTDAFGNFWLPGTGVRAGQRTTMPQFGVSVQYEKDLWGKAGFFGRPRGFAANVAFGIQRTKYDGGSVFGTTWGQSNYSQQNTGFVFNIVENSQTLTPWNVQASLFIPILPTQTKDLKGTASLQLQFYVGQGLRAFGNEWAGNNSYFEFANIGPGGSFANLATWDRELMKRYGGYAQIQYYFNNEWHLSYLYGFAKAYDMTYDRNAALAAAFPLSNPNGYEFATTTDLIRDIQEHNVSLFYRPVKNFKFGLSYAYLRTKYFQITTAGSQQNSVGDNHRVQFAGWFFF